MDGASVPLPWANKEECERAERFRETQGDRVQTLADGLTPELKEIYILERWDGGMARWAAWEISRGVDEEGKRTICTKVRDRDLQ